VSEVKCRADFLPHGYDASPPNPNVPSLSGVRNGKLTIFFYRVCSKTLAPGSGFRVCSKTLASGRPYGLSSPALAGLYDFGRGVTEPWKYRSAPVWSAAGTEHSVQHLGLNWHPVPLLLRLKFLKVLLPACIQASNIGLHFLERPPSSLHSSLKYRSSFSRTASFQPALKPQISVFIFSTILPPACTQASNVGLNSLKDFFPSLHPSLKIRS
jgi:hypothetical protein